MTIAALYVQRNGVYWDVPGIDPWDEARDARLYDGPWPVIAHPPCARWGRYWSGGPSVHTRRVLGDDGGCFLAAFEAVRKWGGVLEHPEGSHGWRAVGWNLPPHDGGWIAAGLDGGWTCCVEQGWYGHRARKKTWLYVYGCMPPALRWGRSPATARIDDGFHSAAERRRSIRTGICQRLSKRQRAATPVEFRDLLISIATACGESWPLALSALAPARPSPPLRPLTPRENTLMRAWLDGLTYIEVRMLYGVNSVTFARTIRALRALGYDLPTRPAAIKSANKPKTSKRPTRTCLRCKKPFEFREDYRMCDDCKNRKT